MIVLEKIATALVMPTGLVWLGLIAVSLLAWRRKQRGLLVCLLVLLAMDTAAGNVPLGKSLLAWLERDYAHVDPLQSGPFDAVFVLGGGTTAAPNGSSQIDRAGDRVALGARLYHAGRTARLVTTGSAIAELNPDEPDPAEETVVIWRHLAIPGDRILRLPGRNTREEMAAIRELAGNHPEWKRLGLVTSAWHMRRAMRLAQENGLSLQPLPADFQGTAWRWNVLSIVPCADGFTRSQLVLKEILAGLAGK